MIPNHDERRSRRIELSIVSKAADKSRRVRQVTCCRPIALMNDDVVMNRKKSSFSRMMFDVSRLERIEQVVAGQMPCKT